MPETICRYNAICFLFAEGRMNKPMDRRIVPIINASSKLKEDLSQNNNLSLVVSKINLMCCCCVEDVLFPYARS